MASAWTASGERSSTASTTDSTRPRLLPSTWLARRRTAIDERDVGLDGGDDLAGRDALLAVTRRSRRLRDSASAGNASSASKAAVRRRPWPSLWRRWTPAASGLLRGDGRDACGRGASRQSGGWAGGGRSPRLSAGCGRMIEPTSATCWVGRTLRQACERRVDPPQRLVAPEHRERLEDARATRSFRRARRGPAGRRRFGLTPRGLDDLAQRRLDALDRRTARRRRAPRARPASASAAVRRASHFSRALGSSAGPSKRKPASGQKSRERLRSSPARDRDRRRRRPVAAGERLEARASARRRRSSRR